MSMFFGTNEGLNLADQSRTTALVKNHRGTTVAGREASDAGHAEHAKTAGPSIDDIGVFLSFHQCALVVCVHALSFAIPLTGWSFCLAPNREGF